MTADQSAARDELAARLARLGLPGGGVKDRRAALPSALKTLHRRLLSAFMTEPGVSDPAVVAGLAAKLGLEPREALAALAAADLVHTDPATGRISVAYPFSGRPTSHRVAIAGGPTVSAMCALDALGIPQMTGRDGQIRSADPASGQPIVVEVNDEVWRFEPATTVVLVGMAAGGDACGVIADCCCPYINFHAGPSAADAYRMAHHGMVAELFDQAEALAAAGQVFGGLLDPSDSQR
jgi:hypothetical protein